MKYYILLSLLVCNANLPMDNQALTQKLKTIIDNGTLDDFKKEESKFTTECNERSLNIGLIACDYRLNAIKQVEQMQADPILHTLVNTLQQISNNSNDNPAYTARINKEKEKWTKDETTFNTALSIVDAIRLRDVWPPGKSIKNICEKLTSATEPAVYLAAETHKLISIQNSLRNILNTAFEEQYNPGNDLCFCLKRVPKS